MAGDTVVVLGSGPVGIASSMHVHLAGRRVILVGGPSGRGLLAREIGVGGVRSDIVDFPETKSECLVLDATPAVAAQMSFWNARLCLLRSVRDGR